MFDLLAQIAVQVVAHHLGNLLWPFLSLVDLLKISLLLIGAVTIELLVRKCRGKRPEDTRREQ